MIGRAAVRAAMAGSGRRLSALAMAQKPHGPFEPPPAPDYADASAWSAYGDAGEGASLDADVFYVHPTAYFGERWNAAYDDADAARQVDQLHVAVQGAALAARRVFAPRYRQMSLGSFAAEEEDWPSARSAAELAYADVAAAFSHFAAHCSGDRPFFIAAHSQGTMLATRLLLEELDGSPLAERCVACYLIGFGMPASVADGLRSFAPSMRPDQVRAIISWNLRADGAEDGGANAELLSRWVPEGLGPMLQVAPPSAVPPSARPAAHAAHAPPAAASRRLTPVSDGPRSRRSRGSRTTCSRLLSRRASRRPFAAWRCRSTSRASLRTRRAAPRRRRAAPRLPRLALALPHLTSLT